MSRIGLVLTTLLLTTAAPAGAVFMESGRIDTPSGGVSLALSANGDAVYASEYFGPGGGGGLQRYLPDGTKAAEWTAGGSPFGIIVEASGNVVLANGANNQVTRYSPAGADLGSFGSDGNGAGKFHNPEDVAIGPGRRHLRHRQRQQPHRA